MEVLLRTPKKLPQPKFYFNYPHFLNLSPKKFSKPTIYTELTSTENMV